MDMRLHAEIQHYTDAVAFWLVEKRDGRRYFAQPATLVLADDGLIVDPTFRLTTSQAQEFFEQLWAMGFRSKHDKGNSEALDAARREHITDLRRAAKLDTGRA